MEQTDMPMTRAQHDHAVAVKLGIIHALKDNIGDDFSAHEIAEAMIDPPDMTPLNVGGILKAMIADGLVAKIRAGGQNLYRLQKKALAWVPPPYDWRGDGQPAAKTKHPSAGKVNGTPVPIPSTRKHPKPPADKPASKRTGPPIANLDASSQRKPADNHPWVHPPAVVKDKPNRGAITRPLPAHLETKPDPRHSPASPDPGALDLDADDLAAMALPVAPQADNPMEASSQLAVDNSPMVDPSPSENPNNSAGNEINSLVIPDSSPLTTDSREDEPLAKPEITPAAISGCGGNGECGGHCANHVQASELEELAETHVGRLTAQLEDAQQINRNMREIHKDYINFLVQVNEDNIHLLAARNQKIEAMTAELDQAQSALADALSDLATSQRERDLLHQRLREQTRNDPAMMADCLMGLLRLALLRIPHPGQPHHFADTGNMVMTSEARP